MGVTIHYRGALDELSRVEDLEDRVLDVVLALGGQATIWRSFDQRDPTRMVRGLLVQMCPGQETLSLLISPEGRLLNVFEIEAAEQGSLDTTSYCFVKTQYGGLQGHVAVVSLLDALRAEFFSNLEVADESGYYELRDPRELARKLGSLGSAIQSLGESIESSALSPEAAEDPEIVAARILRLAELVARKLRTEGQSGGMQEESYQGPEVEEPSLEELVRQHSQIRRRAELRQERLMRRIEESRARGLSTDDALLRALREFELEAECDTGNPSELFPDQPPGSADLAADVWRGAPDAELELWSQAEDDDQPQASESQSAGPFAESGRSRPGGLFESPAEAHLADEDFAAAESGWRHELRGLAEQVYLRLLELGRGWPAENGFYLAAINGAGDLLGGLAQATGRESDSRATRAAKIVQLKRALRGLAFCRGGLFGLHAAAALDESAHRGLQTQLKRILEQIHELLAEAWAE